MRLGAFALVSPSTPRGPPFPPPPPPPQKPPFPVQHTPTLLPSNPSAPHSALACSQLIWDRVLCGFPSRQGAPQGLAPRPFWLPTPCPAPPHWRPGELQLLRSGNCKPLSTRCQCGTGHLGAEKPERLGGWGWGGRGWTWKEAESQGLRSGPGDCVIPSACLWGRWPSGRLAFGGSGLDTSPTWKLSVPSGMGLRRLML